jgi:hypothetical protein
MTFAMRANRSLYILFAALTAITVLSRLIPHWANFAPLGAFALFAGARFPGRWVALLPVLGAMLLSDLLLRAMHGAAYFPHPTTLWVYGAYAAVVLLGTVLRRRQALPLAVGTAVLGSLLFFVLTNTGSWAVSPNGHTPPFTYTPDFAGWRTALEMGWPFYRLTLLADVCYTLVFFGGWAWFTRSRQALAERTA